MKRCGRQILVLALALLMIATMAGKGFSMGEIRTHKITDNIYRLECVGNGSGNVTVYKGQNGLVVVDAGYFGTSEELQKALLGIGNGEVMLLIYTHAHGDHIGGGKAICGGANVVAHHAAADRLKAQYGFMGSESPAEIPNLTLLDSMVLDFEGEEIRLLHFPRAHTDGDVIVHFVNSNVVCLGDLVFTEKLPFIHARLGGTVGGMLESLVEIQDMFPGNTTFIPGHGVETDWAGVAHFHDEAAKMVQLVEAEIDKGMDLNQLVAANVLADWKELSDPVYTTDSLWMAIIYQNKIYAGNPPEPIGDVMLPVILDEGIDAAVDLYHKLKATERDQYDFGETELNNLGYNLMARKMLDQAAVLFKMNLELFPASANVYDSWGEVCMVRGDVDLAIKNYEKSLQLNPDNQNAVDMLKKLRQSL